MNPSISVILPVYNAERYLRECIESICALDESLDWELIVVDDGSSDSSARICDEYSAKNQHVRVFHIENKGVSNARNFGIKNACKDFVTFIDADDWIDADAFTRAFLSFFEYKADIGFTPFYKSVENRCEEVALTCGETRLLSQDEKRDLLVNRVAPSDRFFGFVWRNFYSRTLVSRIEFDVELKYNEDVLFVVQALFAASQVAIINISFYYYRINELSVSFNKEINSIDARKLGLKKMLEWADENGVDLSYTKVKRMCAIYARMFAIAAAKSHRGAERIRTLWEIHSDIPFEEYRHWKTRFWGKSFVPYVVLCRRRLSFLGFLYLCLRFF